VAMPVRAAVALALMALIVLPMLMVAQGANAQMFPGQGEYGSPGGGGGSISAFVQALLAWIFALLRSILGPFFGGLF
jgi:hypothetical protein